MDGAHRLMIGKASTISANWKSGVKVEGGFQDYVARAIQLGKSLTDFMSDFGSILAKNLRMKGCKCSKERAPTVNLAEIGAFGDAISLAG